MSSNLSGLQNKEERIQVVPSFPACSKTGENCISTGCCQVSGHKCFSKGKGQAQCNKTCTAGVKGFTCDVIDPPSGAGGHAARAEPLLLVGVHGEYRQFL